MKKLLVVVDPQNDFITGELGSEYADKVAEQVAEKIRSWDGLIYVTMDTHCPETYGCFVEGKRIKPHCMKATEGWKIDERILKALKATYFTLVEKNDSFGLFELAGYLERNNIDCVEFVGYCTDICVISNALMLRSLKPYIDISVDALCCAGTTFRAHNEALDIMEKCCIDIVNRV